MPVTHGLRFALLLALVILAACFFDVRVYLALAYPLYVIGLLLLVGVEVAGTTRMGATRWLDIGPMSLQPSEIMKIAIVLALARYYHNLDPRRAGTFLALIPPLIMIAAPVALDTTVLRSPAPSHRIASPVPRATVRRSSEPSRSPVPRHRAP